MLPLFAVTGLAPYQQALLAIGLFVFAAVLVVLCRDDSDDFYEDEPKN